MALGLAGAAAATPAAHRLATPSRERIGSGPLLIRDSTLARGAARAVLTGPSWGGTYTTPSGVSLQILVSTSYPEDPAVPQRWADFLDSLVHGPELGSLSVYLAPIAEVRRQCGPGAIACYSHVQSLLVAPGEEVESGISAEAVVTHEYGHHIASNRSNAPWVALDTGPKRWASYEQVCSRTNSGRLFPGAEDLVHYELNPGEGFAESYRVLNERRAGVPEVPWEIVSQQLYPDDAALATVEQDVVDPWQGAVLSTLGGKLVPGSSGRGFTVETPLDGDLRVTLRAPARSSFTVDLLLGSTSLAHAATTPAARTRTVQTHVCGARSFRIVVRRTSGSGTFSLAVARP